MINDKGISVENNLQETIASNIKALHKKSGCKTAGGRRMHRRVRKKPLFDKKQNNNYTGDGVEDVSGSDNKGPMPKVTGLAQLKNLEKQVQDLQKNMSSIVDKSTEKFNEKNTKEYSEECSEEIDEGN